MTSMHRVVQVGMGCTRTVAIWHLASLVIATAVSINAQNLTNHQGLVKDAAKTIAAILPASRAEVVALEGVVNSLVAKVNSLTPVSSPSQLARALESVMDVTSSMPHQVSMHPSGACPARLGCRDVCQQSLDWRWGFHAGIQWHQRHQWGAWTAW